MVTTRYLLLTGLLLTTIAYAEPSAEELYQQVVSRNEEIQEILELAPEGDGYWDYLKQSNIEQLFLDNQQALERSANAGFAPAQYVLAATLISGKKSPEAACDLLDRAERQNLLAASVYRFKTCIQNRDFPFYDQPDKDALLEPLRQALSRKDPFAEYYPLGIMTTACFHFRRPPIDTSSSKQMITSLYPILLEHDEFKAEAYWILGINQKAFDNPYLSKAAKLGCEMPPLKKQ